MDTVRKTLQTFKSGAAWEKELAPDVVILDHEGWDSGTQYHYEQITRDEFEHRLAQSRIIAPRGLYFLWKDKTQNG